MFELAECRNTRKNNLIYLVTGGAGFIGSALANTLSAVGHEVRVLDDLSASGDSRLDENVLFTRGDVNDRPRLWTLLQGVECVYHLAARVSVQESILYPREYNAVNVGGTVALMEAIRDAGVRRVVLASSGAVYGNQTTQPLRENMEISPDSPYAVSKRSAELYVHTIGSLWNIETVALRIFNAYGPYQPLPAAHAPVVPRFLANALSGQTVMVNGDGNQTRDFVYISDVVNALIAASTAPKINRQVINVGSGSETSIRQLAQAVQSVLGKQFEPIYRAHQAGGVARMCADLAVAQELLGYQPQVSLMEGLTRMRESDSRFG
jgi:UDP-glucose 4-epimerase